MKKNLYLPILLGILALSLSPALFADKSTDIEASRETLSIHQTTAEFQGLTYRRCMGRTAACPEKCGHSGEFATFKIINYLNYQKPGKYGDAKQETYQIQVSDFEKKSINQKLAPVISKLKKGDQVLLSWSHDYVTTKGGSKFPERTVSTLQAIKK